MRWLVPLGAVVAFALVGCHKPEPPPPPIKAPPPAPLAGARATVSPVAFDLVSVRDGAVLVWGQRPDSGGGVRMLRLGPLGQPLGRSEPVVDPTRGGAEAGPSNALSEDVLVSAFVANERLAIVWASRTPGGEVSLRVAEGPVSGAAFSAPRTLSRIRPVPGASARAYAYADPSVAGPSAVLYRGAESPCDDKKRCETYWWNAPGDPSLAQQPIPFKRPCEPAVAGLLRRGDRASALLCEIGDSGPTTTLVQVMPPLPAANDAAETTEPPKGRRGRRGKDARRAKHTKAPEPPPEATPPAPPAPPPP
ncbi:MAG: hypothetical protein KC543_06420, partial [Myxococcales bacterium]|nr:hypothetical protein [Myxococcales bacterium]